MVDGKHINTTTATATATAAAAAESIPVDKVLVGFAIYGVGYSAATSTLFVAGGGGPAKSGVRNAIISYKYTGKTRRVRQVCELSCGQEAPTCLALHPRQPEYIGLGVNDRCWVVERDETDRLSLQKSVRSDFAPDDSYQKIVRFSPDGHELLTSGTENKVRLWHFPWMEMTTEFALPVDASASAKDQRIEDADYDPSGSYIAVCSPVAIHIRSRSNGSFVASIAPREGYGFRCVRFLQEEGAKRAATFLVTIENGRGQQQPILSLWKISTWTRHRSTTLGSRLGATSLAISENGRMIAFGSADGTVAVYDAQLYLYFYKCELHKFIVPALAVSDHGGQRLLISGSPDGTFKVTHIRKSRPWTWIGLFLFLLFLAVGILFGLFAAGIIGGDQL